MAYFSAFSEDPDEGPDRLLGVRHPRVVTDHRGPYSMPRSGHLALVLSCAGRADFADRAAGLTFLLAVNSRGQPMVLGGVARLTCRREGWAILGSNQ